MSSAKEMQRMFLSIQSLDEERARMMPTKLIRDKIKTEYDKYLSMTPPPVPVPTSLSPILPNKSSPPTNMNDSFILNYDNSFAAPLIQMNDAYLCPEPQPLYLPA